MDGTNWRPSLQDPSLMEGGGDWRTQIQTESRDRIINKIKDTLTRHVPCSGPDDITELGKIAVRFEEKIFSVATSQSDYLRRISLKLLTMESKSLNNMANGMASNSMGMKNPHDPDSTAQTGGSGDWQEEVYQKIKVLKDMYFTDLSDMFHKISIKLQQNDSLPQQPKSEQLDKLRAFRQMLERLLHFLQVMNKNSIHLGHKEKVGAVERQILSVMHANKWPSIMKPISL